MKGVRDRAQSLTKHSVTCVSRCTQRDGLPLTGVGTQAVEGSDCCYRCYSSWVTSLSRIPSDHGSGRRLRDACSGLRGEYQLKFWGRVGQLLALPGAFPCRRDDLRVLGDPLFGQESRGLLVARCELAFDDQIAEIVLDFGDPATWR